VGDPTPCSVGPVGPAAVQGQIQALRELRCGSRDGGLEASVDRLGLDVVACHQPRSHPAPLIDAPQRVHGLGQAHRHPPHPRAETAEGEQHTPHDSSAQGFGEADVGAQHVDSQGLATGIR
jgi:hypothetical protein